MKRVTSVDYGETIKVERKMRKYSARRADAFEELIGHIEAKGVVMLADVTNLSKLYGDHNEAVSRANNEAGFNIAGGLFGGLSMVFFAVGVSLQEDLDSLILVSLGCAGLLAVLGLLTMSYMRRDKVRL